MLVIAAMLACCAWLAVLLLPSRPWATRERIEASADAGRVLDRVCVLIPARNEADTIGRTLAALALQGDGLTVTVIDDQSGDGTADRARAAASASGLTVQVLEGKPLPAGWGGKLWALEQGLARADRDYCLLLDAEIELAPRMLGTLLDKAETGQLAMVSVMARLRCRSFWERLLVPPFIFFFKLLYPFRAVNAPRRRTAAAAGGCILIRTEALREIGGFNAMRDALIDDCTLAGNIKRSGHAIWLGLSHSVSSSRAYDSLAVFRSMVARTAFTQLRYSNLLLVLVTLIMLIMFVVPWIALFWPADATQRLPAVLALLLMTAVYAPTVRFYELPLWWTVTLPIAGVLFLAMTLESAVNYWRGLRAEWKGRTYAAR